MAVSRLAANCFPLSLVLLCVQQDFEEQLLFPSRSSRWFGLPTEKLDRQREARLESFCGNFVAACWSPSARPREVNFVFCTSLEFPPFWLQNCRAERSSKSGVPPSLILQFFIFCSGIHEFPTTYPLASGAWFSFRDHLRFFAHLVLWKRRRIDRSIDTHCLYVVL